MYSRSQVNKSKGNHYPSDDPEIVDGDRLTPAQVKLAYCVVMMAGFGLKSAKKIKCYTVAYKQTAMHRQGNHMINASQDSGTFHKFGLTGLTLL
jgi:hypothetical protein